MNCKKFLGKWSLCDTKNFDKFLEKIGSTLAHRAEELFNNPSILFEEVGTNWKIQYILGSKIQHIEFTLGKEFFETSIDGREMKSNISIFDDVLEQTQYDINSGKNTRINYVAVEENLFIYYYYEELGCVATRMFKKDHAGVDFSDTRSVDEKEYKEKAEKNADFITFRVSLEVKELRKEIEGLRETNLELNQVIKEKDAIFVVTFIN